MDNNVTYVVITSKCCNQSLYLRYVNGLYDYNYWSITSDIHEAYKFNSKEEFIRISKAIVIDTGIKIEDFNVEVLEDVSKKIGEFKQLELF